MKKLKEEELNEIGFFKSDKNNHLYYSEGGELEYNTTTNELFSINEGIGEKEMLCKTHNITSLIFLFENYEGYTYYKK